MAWSRSTAISTACRTARAGGQLRCIARPTRFAFLRTAPSLLFIRFWTAAVSVASWPGTGRYRHRQTARPLATIDPIQCVPGRSWLFDRWRFMTPSANAWPRTMPRHEGSFGSSPPDRADPSSSGQPAHATGPGSTGSYRPAARAWRDQRNRGDRDAAGRGTHHPRKPSGQGGPANGAPDADQDVVGVLL